MSQTEQKNILVIKTNLFSDQPTMVRAVQAIKSTANIRTVEIVGEQMDDTAWDNVLEQIMSADMVLAL